MPAAWLLLAGLIQNAAASGVTEWTIVLPSARPPSAAVKGVPQKGAEGCVYDGKTGLPLEEGLALERVLASRAVYAGEAHDKPSHHDAQRRLLKALSESGPAAAGFEMLHASKPSQEALDAYAAGAITGEEFQKKVDWPKTWGFPFKWYEPIFELLRAHGGKGAALNVPRAIVHKVAVSGLESLTAEERAYVPAEMRRPEDPVYLGLLKATFREHARDPNDAAALGRYLDAMTLWNEGMAERAALFLRENPGRRLLVVAGAFHAVDAAMPAGVARRLPGVRQTSVVLVESKSCPERLPAESLSPAADLVWLVAPLGD